LSTAAVTLLKQNIFMKKAFLSLFMLAVIAVACNNDQAAKTDDTSTATPEVKADTTAAKPETPKDIVDIAIGSPDHTTLVSALTAGGLVETLKGAGPFTVFAPTNAAFNALPAGTLDALLKPEKKDDLTKILTYHVVAGSVKAADLKDGQKVKTLQGGELTVSIKDGVVTINGAKVTAADLSGTNGVVHVIDAVLLPK
jgi:uncharacterized surface protein with fasciclin (FAS1) repeats